MGLGSVFSIGKKFDSPMVNSDSFYLICQPYKECKEPASLGALLPLLPKLVWQTAFCLAITKGMWIFVCSLSHPCLALRESACFLHHGVGGLQHKGKGNSCQAFMKRLSMYGKVEVTEFPNFSWFLYFCHRWFLKLVNTVVTEWPSPGGYKGFKRGRIGKENS